MVFVVVLAELALLLFISRALNQAIYTLLYRIIHNEHAAVVGTTLLFFPGTVVHELSHLFVAEILGVRTGRLQIFPKRINEDYIQAGSVEVAKTDPFRRTLIGLAPVLVGVITCALLSQWLTALLPDIRQAFSTSNWWQAWQLYAGIGGGYLLFCISNNMFSSPEDMKGVPAVLIVVILFIVALYLMGVRIAVTGQLLAFLSTIAQSMTINLGIVLIGNALILGIVWGLLRLRSR